MAKAQLTDAYTSSPLFWIPKITTYQVTDAKNWQVEIANRKRVPAPHEVFSSYTQRVKEQLNQAKETISYPSSIQSRELAPSPEQLAGFHGNDYNGSHPNDNHIAISTNGKIVSVSNSQFCVYEPTGNLLRKSSLQAFADTAGGQRIKYDPRILYHPIQDRFAAVFLSGTYSAHSQIIVAFSATASPEGAWHLYSLPGTPPELATHVYADYPQIGFSTTELFISVNLFGDNDDLYGACIWQISAIKGFGGDSLELKAHILPGIHSLTPIHGMPKLHDAPFYFARKSALQGADNFQFFEIRTALSNGGLMAPAVTLSSGTNYFLSPDNSQKGTNQLLNNGDSRLQAAYRIDSSCYFVMPTRDRNKPAIYLGQLKLDANGIANSNLSASIITHDTLELAFPNLTYAGYSSGQKKHAHAITFNYSSPFHYPGNGLVYIDTSGRVSPFSLNTQSQTFTGSGDVNVPFRWGDYTGIASRWPGEVWTAGYYIRADGYNSSWLSQVKVGNNPLMNVHENGKPSSPPWRMFPNPAKDHVKLEIEIQEPGIYTIEVFDLQGKKIGQLLNDKLWPGKASLEFSTDQLTKGLYFIRISGGNIRSAQKLEVY